VILGELLDPVNGRVKHVQDRYDQAISDIEASIERLNARFAAAEESLIKQFAALESAVSEIQTTGNFLAAQLTSTIGLSVTGR
jgi:flagellar capping protein FliD